jgi:glycyl-tRNA synthetase
MFIVKKEKDGRKYYYLRESVRENGKVKTRDVAYLGKEKKEAEKKMKMILSENKAVAPKGVPRDISREMPTRGNISIEDMATFCKRKGFVYSSSEIYGGFSGFWDFGPLGVELFNNIKKDWWNHFVQQKKNMVGIDASIISHPRTWKASGHLEKFNDVFVKCKKCGTDSKLDESELGKVKCECGGDYESKGKFNLMFETKVGVVNPDVAYLRGETAQGMFMDFRLIQQTSRMQLPFGVAQIGKCFRNEIAPRDFLFRVREFNLAEFEFFINPDEEKCDLLEKKHLNLKFKFLDEETQKKGKCDLRDITIKKLLEEKRLGEWHAYWLAEQILWYYQSNLFEIKIREHTKDELSHYSSATFDVDYDFPFGSKELGGNANRGQYDLMQHQKESKEKMEIFDEKYKNKIIPRVIEPTFGMDRVFLAVLTKAYSYDKEKNNIVLRLPAKLAPIKAAIFPIVKEEKMIELSKRIYDDLKKEFNVNYDESGSVGRRYARNDEIGTPFCITVDEDSLKGKDVTIRDRDTTKQIRIKVSELKDLLRKLISEEIKFEELLK